MKEGFLLMPSLELEEFIYSLARFTKVEKGETIYKQGEDILYLHMVKRGKVRVTKKLVDGREVSLQIAKNDDLIGEGGFFTLQNHSSNAYAMEDSEIAYVDKQAFQSKIINDSKLLLELIKWQDENELRNQSKFRDLLHFGKKGALYSTLIRMANSYGIIKIDGILIDVKVTNQTLSDLCGATRESVNKMLKELEDLNVISVNQKYIKIHNLDYLKSEIHCLNCPFDICQL